MGWQVWERPPFLGKAADVGFASARGDRLGRRGLTEARGAATPLWGRGNEGVPKGVDSPPVSLPESRSVR